MLSHWWPGLGINPASFVIVGMAGFFAAAAKTPFSTIVIVSEMTGGYRLLLPALWVCMLAFILSDQQSIYYRAGGEPVPFAGSSRELRAGCADRNLCAAIPDKQTCPCPLFDRAIHCEPFSTGSEVCPYSVLPVVDADQRLLGVVNLEEVHVAAQSESLKPFVLAEDLMRGT